MNTQCTGYSQLELVGTVEKIADFYSTDLIYDITINTNNHKQNYMQNKNRYNLRFRTSVNSLDHNYLNEIKLGDLIKIKLIVEEINYTIINYNSNGEYILEALFNGKFIEMKKMKMEIIAND